MWAASSWQVPRDVAPGLSVRVPVGGAQLAVEARRMRQLPLHRLPGQAPVAAMTVLAYVCHKCGTSMGDALPYCRTCQDDMLAIQAATSQPEPIRHQQRIAICQLFKTLGVMHKATRMRDLSRYIGRDVSDYDQLTAAEADTAAKALRERNRGR